MSTKPLRWPSGSAYICPQAGYNDLDFMMYLEEVQVGAYRQSLLDAGWESCSAAEYPDRNKTGWEAFRAGQWNLILCWNATQYMRWLAATELAKVLNLTTKEERISLFQSVRDGVISQSLNIIERTRSTGEAKYQEFVNEH